MGKLVDEVFCQYAVENEFVDAQIIELFRSRFDNITIRENLLLNNYLSWTNYCAVISHFQHAKDLVDSELSLQHDTQFLQFAVESNLVSHEQIKQCREQYLSSPWTTRELLVFSEIITLDKYQNIMLRIMEEKLVVEENNSVAASKMNFASDNSLSSEDVSAETMIDDESLEAINEFNKTYVNPNDSETDVSDETLVDAEAGAEATPTDVTIINNNAIAAQTNVFFEKNENFSQSTTKSPADNAIATDLSQETILDTGNTATTIDPTLSDSSQETLVDAEAVDLKAGAGEESATPSYSLDENAASAQTIVEGSNILEQVQQSYTSSSSDYVPPSFTEHFPPPTFIENTSTTSPLDSYNSNDKSSEQEELVETLVKKITHEVYLQTQQISSNVGENLKGYRVLLGFAVFCSLFLIIFIGWLEYQRIQEIDKSVTVNKKLLRKNQDLQQQKQLLQEKLKDPYVLDIVQFNNNPLGQLAYCYWLEADHTNCREILRQLVHREQANPVYHLYLGHCEVHLHRFAAAIRAYRQAIKLRPAEGRFYYALGNAYLASNKIQKALSNYEIASASGYQNLAMNLKRLTGYLRGPNYVEDFSTLKNEVKKQFANDYLFHRQMATMYLQHQQFSSAQKHLAIVRDLQPQNWQTYYQLALTQYRLGKYKEAAELSEKSLKKFRDTEAKARFYAIYALSAKSKKAHVAYKKALKLGREDDEALLLVAEYLYRKADNPELALKALKYVKERNFNARWRVYASRGQLYYLGKEYSKAYKDWHKALELNPALLELRKKLQSLPPK